MSRKSGFTLLELLIVITLIGILAGIAVIRYGPVAESARQAEAYTVLAEIVTSEKRYYLDNNNTYAAIINPGDWAQLDSFSSDPSDASNNFTFTVPSTDETTGYARATSEVGGLNYWMCLKSGNRDSGDIPNCN